MKSYASASPNFKIVKKEKSFQQRKVSGWWRLDFQISLQKQRTLFLALTLLIHTEE